MRLVSIFEIENERTADERFSLKKEYNKEKFADSLPRFFTVFIVIRGRHMFRLDVDLYFTEIKINLFVVKQKDEILFFITKSDNMHIVHGDETCENGTIKNSDNILGSKSDKIV